MVWTSLFDQVTTIARTAPMSIGIGVGPQYVDRTVRAAKRAAAEGLAKITLVGDEASMSIERAEGVKVRIVKSPKPWETMLDLLDEGGIDGVVRGSFASSFALVAKQRYGTMERIALLETVNHYPFFLAPVGVEEGETPPEKFLIVKGGCQLVEALGFSPKVSVLSGGRTENKGPIIEKSRSDALQLVQMARRAGIPAIHHEILIEDAIGDANIILAPDGISGNLIYRTLVHLGGGRSHGAPYLNQGGRIIVDTSRVGPVEEYVSAIALASALAGIKKGKGR